MYTGIQKSKYHWADFLWNINIKVYGYNMEIFYTMIDYKLRVVRYEYDTLNFSPMRQNSNVYPSGEKNCGDDSSMFLQDYRHLCVTFVVENTDLISNKFSEIIKIQPYPLSILVMQNTGYS